MVKKSKIHNKQQKDGSWNNDEIDSSYAMIALGDGGIKNERGCEWLFRNYGKNWEYVGTTSLIITALLKQNKKKYLKFIISREIDIDQIDPSIQWLLGKQIEGSWGKVTSTSLSLISLKMYLYYQLEHESLK